MPRSPSPKVTAYQLRIQLRGVSPPIWRRVIVPATVSIRTLHAVTQASMGWENIHLNQFTIRGYADIPSKCPIPRCRPYKYWAVEEVFFSSKPTRN